MRAPVAAALAVTLLAFIYHSITVSSPRNPDSRVKAETGRQAHLAARAAAKATGGGFLMHVEHDSRRGVAWEVEFARLDGHRVSVLLDDQLRLIRVTRGKTARETALAASRWVV